MADDKERRSKAPKFDGTDWWTWRFRFEQWAVAEGVQGFFDGTVDPRPAAAGDAQNKWDDRQRRAFADLVQALVPDNLIEMVREYGTRRERQPPAQAGGQPQYTVIACRPQEAWACLESYFEQQALSSRLIYERQLTSLHMEAGEAVVDYWARAKTLHQKLRSAGGEMSSQTWMGRVITGLPDTWETLKVVLDGEMATLAEDRLRNRLRGEEERQLEKSSGAAMYSRGAPQGTGQPSLKLKTKPKRKGKAMPDRGKKGPAPAGHCHGCHKKGHSWHECFSRPGDAVPECVKGRRKGDAAAVDQQDQCDGELAMVVGEASVAAMQRRDGWWIDSCATHNFTNNPADFNGPLTKGEVGLVRLGDGHKVPVQGMGEVSMRGSNGKKLILTKVHYVPSLHTRLISVVHLTAKNFDVLFTGKKCTVSKEGKGVFLEGYKENGADHGLVQMEVEIVHTSPAPAPDAQAAAAALETAAVPTPATPESAPATAAPAEAATARGDKPQHRRLVRPWLLLLTLFRWLTGAWVMWLPQDLSGWWLRRQSQA